MNDLSCRTTTKTARLVHNIYKTNYYYNYLCCIASKRAINNNHCFQVAFLRTWFANSKVDRFAVSVWFKRHGEQVTPQGIVNNGDGIDTAGFLIGHAKRTVMADVSTEVQGHVSRLHR